MTRWLVLLLLFAPPPTLAEQAVHSEPFIVHYAAIPTVDLSPQTARALGIPRSRHRAVVVLNVQRQEGTRTVPVPAQGSGSVKNLLGQQQELTLRAVQERGAHYLLADFGISNREWLRFDFEVLPQGSGTPVPVRFRQQFYTD